MSEPTLPNPDPGTENEPAVEDNGGHPAWDKVYDDVFGVLPEGLHGPVKERLSKHFDEWDHGVQERFGKVHSEYEDYKPFKEAGVSAQQLEAAMALYQLADTDPKMLYDQMGQFYKFGEQQPSGNEQGQNQNQPEGFDLDDPDAQQQQKQYNLENDPRYQELAQNQQALQQHLSQQYEAELQAQADQELDVVVKGIEKKYPGIDMDYVSTKALLEAQRTNKFDDLNGLFENAAKAYNDHVTRIRQAPRANDSAPTVMSGNGDTPVVSRDPSELSAQDRRAQMVQMLNLAEKQE